MSTITGICQMPSPHPHNSSTQYLHIRTCSSVHLHALQGQQALQLEAQQHSRESHHPWNSDMSMTQLWQQIPWVDSTVGSPHGGAPADSHVSATAAEAAAAAALSESGMRSSQLPSAWQSPSCDVMAWQESQGCERFIPQNTSLYGASEHLKSTNGLAFQAWPSRQQRGHQGHGLQQDQYQQEFDGGLAESADGGAGCSFDAFWRDDASVVHFNAASLDKHTREFSDPLVHMKQAAGQPASAVWLTEHLEGSSAGFSPLPWGDVQGEAVPGTHSSSSAAGYDVHAFPGLLDDSSSAVVAHISHDAAVFQQPHAAGNSPVWSGNVGHTAAEASLAGPAALTQQVQDASLASAWTLIGTEGTIAPDMTPGNRVGLQLKGPNQRQPDDASAGVAIHVTATTASAELRSADIELVAPIPAGAEPAADDIVDRGTACSANIATQGSKRSASTAGLPPGKPASATAEAATTRISRRRSSLSGSGMLDKALLHVPPASHHKKRLPRDPAAPKGSSALQHRSRLQKKHDELQAVKGEMAALRSSQEADRSKMESLRAENTDLLTRLTDVTAKWRQSVTENAGLTQALGHLQQQLANLQQSLTTWPS